jgi:anthranilate phosphoribosyltransferase
MNILEGNGTEQQNSVVLANASVALYHTHKFGTYDDCFCWHRKVWKVEKH